MTEGHWHGRSVTGPMHPDLAVLVAHLIDLPVRSTGADDQCTRTHLQRVTTARGLYVHAVADRWPGFLATGCGDVLLLRAAVFTARGLSCLRPGCAVRSQQNDQCPAPVDRPGGALEGDAAKTNNRRHATSNGVAGRTDRDRFQSVKNAPDNGVKVGRKRRSQVVTAEQIAAAIAETTSPGKAHRRRPPRA